MTFPSRAVGTAALACALVASNCGRPEQLRVGVFFDTSWRLPGTTLTPPEIDLVRTTALDTLRAAFEAFAVTVTDGSPGSLLIRIEDTPPSSYGAGNPVHPGAVGLTFPLVTTSRVRIDALYSIELAVARCNDTACAVSREELLKGLGHGVGATAAHELGHQTGLEFTTDVDCTDCYDGLGADTDAHFFGVEHWSPKAVAIMRRVLPARDPGVTPASAARSRMRTVFATSRA